MDVKPVPPELQGKSKGGWILFAIGALGAAGIVSQCQRQEYSEGVRIGADRAWEQCLANGNSRSLCDCVSSEARSRANRLSASEAKDMTRADIEAMNSDILRVCNAR